MSTDHLTIYYQTEEPESAVFKYWIETRGRYLVIQLRDTDIFNDLGFEGAEVMLKKTTYTKLSIVVYGDGNVRKLKKRILESADEPIKMKYKKVDYYGPVHMFNIMGAFL